MNYNKQNKGFVCFIYSLIGSRALWALVAIVMLNLALASLGSFGVSLHEVAESLGFASPYLPGALPAGLQDDGIMGGFSLQAAKAGVIVAAFFLASLAAVAVAISPRIFIVRLLGFFVILGAVFVATERLAKEQMALCYVSAAAGAMVFVLLISWFVYNARSSEINEL